MPSHGKQRRKQFSMWKIKTFIALTLLTIAAIAVTTIPQNPFTPQTSETTPTFIIYNAMSRKEEIEMLLTRSRRFLETAEHQYEVGYYDLAMFSLEQAL
ncbi:MAG: HEPN domain-containing protein, partial [Candidatus Caldarchaeum sp.]